MKQNVKIDPAALDKLFEPFDRTDAPGFAVGVALGGRPVYRRGVGMASVELPVALSPTIRMRIGSTTKHFCVLAAMLLAEEGKLSIDDSPRRYIQELPEWAEPVTIRQLMSHTSGMRDCLDLILHAAGPGRSAGPDTQLKMLSRLDSVNFLPGKSWSYNNGGYVLLTEIIERVSGKEFGAFLRERILDPIGMYDTLVRPLDSELLANSATLHVSRPDGGWERGDFGTPIKGEGGIASTVDDMLLWLRHMSNPIVGTPATWEAMRTPVVTSGYGLGLTMDSYRGLRTVHHAGAVVGGSSQMIKVIDHELDIIIMTNGISSIHLYELVDRIIDTCIPDLPAPEWRVPEAPVVTGTFYSRDTARVLKLEERDGIQAIDLGGLTLPARLHPDDTLSVALLSDDFRVRILSDEAIEVHENGETDRLDRVVVPVGANLDDYLGEYANSAAQMRAQLTREEDGGFRLLLQGELGECGYVVTPIGPNLWQAHETSRLPLVLTLEFQKDGFLMTTGRTNRLRFVPA
ncbi:MAG: serine hydrolase domain-containing protein [Gluconobacter cerinus]|uniref:serine hydrolase domain-containing protein n=1 Tax=Gluconobacter cerinus TaxID=38307 RepID=UPI0039EA36A3